MILRVPDYYDEFSCIAGECTGSCCDGWEIDIDDATREYYSQVPGEIGERLRDKLYKGEDGEYRFRLGEHGRCPFLNDDNLCDIIIALGEEALSEVCTDFPRFALSYGHVMQRILSVSCEEVGRIILSRTEPVKFVERSMPDCMEDWEDEEADDAYIALLETIQNRAIAILQDRSKPISERIALFLGLCEKAQEGINQYGMDEDAAILTDTLAELEHPNASTNFRVEDWERGKDAQKLYDAFDIRWAILEELEELGEEWVATKKRVRKVLTEENYAERREAFMTSDAYDAIVYEQLLVYFAFRYLMQAVYSCDLLAYGKMIVSFALMVRDLDLMCWTENGGIYELKQRTRMAYIFSREVEHSEENFEQIREELMFE